MRDKLVELLKDSQSLDVLHDEYNEWNKAADYLIENGITILPCKPGDIVYLTPRYNGKPTGAIVADKVQMIGITSRGVYITTINNRDFHVLGYGIYLSKEEATEELKKESEAK